MRLIASLLIVTTLAPTWAPFAHAATVAGLPEAPAGTSREEYAKREAKLHSYFEGCNNHISDTLVSKGLERDAGNRPTPLMILGMDKQDDNAAKVPFTSEDEAAMNAEGPEATNFLRGLYVQGMENAVTAWIRMQIQYNDAKLDPVALTEKFCSLGTKCTAAARGIVAKTAATAVAEAKDLTRFPHYTPTSAAEIINQEVRRANDELDLVKTKPKYTFTEFLKGLPHLEVRTGVEEPITPAQLARYREVYEAAAIKDGPMRLLAVPRINSTVGALQTPYQNLGVEDILMEFVDGRDGKRYPARWNNGYGTVVRDHRLPNDGLITLSQPYGMLTHHGYVAPATIKKAVADALSSIESLISDMNDSVAPKAIRTQAKIQQGIVDIIGGTGLAAHEVLLDFPELAPTACRSLKQFAIEHAQSHRNDRYRRNAIIAAGIFVAVVTAGTNIFVSYAVVSVTTGEMVISGVAWGFGMAFIANSVVNLVYAYNKLNANVGAVLAGNESPTVIITRIPEEIDAIAAGWNDLFINAAFGVMNTWFAVRDVGLLLDPKKAAAVLGPASPLWKTLSVGTGKVMMSSAKFTPVFLKAMSYWSFQDLRGTVIHWEETPGSGTITRAQADIFDDKRQQVLLNVIDVTTPDKKTHPPTVKVIEMPLDVFRSVIRGTR